MRMSRLRRTEYRQNLRKRFCHNINYFFMKIKVIITGASGMVGEGVLYECLQSNDVEEILVIGRRSCNYTHLKLKEIVHPDMYNLSSIEDQLEDYDACFFCLGMSSVGVKEPEFTKVTYDLTMHFATTL